MAKKRDTRWIRDDWSFAQWVCAGFGIAVGLALLIYPCWCVIGG